MKLNHVFTIWAVIMFILGLVFLLAPEMLLTRGGNPPSPGEIGLGRLLGGFHLGFAVLAWLARSITETSARRKIVVSVLVLLIVNLLVFLKATLIDGRTTVADWFNVILVAVFVCIYGYFYITKRE